MINFNNKTHFISSNIFVQLKAKTFLKTINLKVITLVFHKQLSKDI